MIVEMTSMAVGRGNGALHSLPQHVRQQTAQDYARAAPGIYNLPNTWQDLSPHLSSISFPTLVVWGERDQTLLPASFPKLVNAMPRAIGKRMPAGHALHQSNAAEFNQMVKDFLKDVSK